MRLPPWVPTRSLSALGAAHLGTLQRVGVNANPRLLEKSESRVPILRIGAYKTLL